MPREARGAHDVEESADRQSAAASILEERTPAPCDARRALPEQLRHRADRGRADGGTAVLATLAGPDEYDALDEINVVGIEPAQLRHAQAAAVGQPQRGAVAGEPPALAVGPGHHLGDIRFGKRPRQRAPDPRGSKPLGRALLDAPFTRASSGRSCGRTPRVAECSPAPRSCEPASAENPSRLRVRDRRVRGGRTAIPGRPRTPEGCSVKRLFPPEAIRGRV